MSAEDGNGDWSTWSKWVRDALKTVIRSVGELTNEVSGIKDEIVPRLATLEERCSPEKMQALTEGVQENRVSLAKMGGAGLLGGGTALALLKLVEALVINVQAGGTP